MREHKIKAYRASTSTPAVMNALSAHDVRYSHINFLRPRYWKMLDPSL